MSVSSINEAQLLQFYQYDLIQNYIVIMAMSVYMTMRFNAALTDARLGIFVYDSIISFNREWRAVWSCKITGATAIYLALRYVTLADVIMDIINDTVTSCEIGFISGLVETGTFCGTYLAQAAFVSIRVYAIDGRQWMKATIVMLLGLVPVALNIVICFALWKNHSLPQKIILLLVTRMCILMSNLLVVISTWQATRASRSVTAWSSRGSLTAVLFRDGTVHFACTNTFFDHSLKSSTPRISTVVLCRFFLNLRQFSSPDVNDSTMASHTSSFSSFASRIIGNLGEMLEDEPQAPDDNDFEGELDGMKYVEEVDGAVDPDDSAHAISDAYKAQTPTATTAMFELETDKGGAANPGFPEASDEGFEQRVIDIV
ncbi:predicted protein [Postia placenta Mad-698-R]|nr:predicted protein [Postia placenta Mad-698-R]